MVSYLGGGGGGGKGMSFLAGIFKVSVFNIWHFVMSIL